MNMILIVIANLVLPLALLSNSNSSIQLTCSTGPANIGSLVNTALIVTVAIIGTDRAEYVRYSILG